MRFKTRVKYDEPKEEGKKYVANISFIMSFDGNSEPKEERVALKVSASTPEELKEKMKDVFAASYHMASEMRRIFKQHSQKPFVQVSEIVFDL